MKYQETQQETELKTESIEQETESTEQWEDIVPLPEPLVLISEWRFTGLEPIEADNDYNGGYLYRDRTEDMLTVITNCCFVINQEVGESLEDYICRTVQEIGGAEPRELSWEENEVYSRRFTYPIFILSWQTDTNGKIHGCDGLFFMTDTHTYLYTFDTTIDNQLEMQEVWQEVFGQLNLR